MQVQIQCFNLKINFWIHTLLMKLLFPTLGKPQMMIVLVYGSMLGNLAKCCLTCSKYVKFVACLFIMVAIRPRAAFFNCLHLYRESPYLSRRTYSLATLKIRENSFVKEINKRNKKHWSKNGIGQQTCRLNVWLYWFDPKPICSDPCRTERSSSQRRMDEHHRALGTPE